MLVIKSWGFFPHETIIEASKDRKYEGTKRSEDVTLWQSNKKSTFYIKGTEGILIVYGTNKNGHRIFRH